MSATVSLQDATHDIALALIADRQHLHQHPELAWHQVGTAMLASVAVQYLNQQRAYPRTPAVTSR